MKNHARYRTLAAHLRERFGQRVQKIPLDAGLSCPNRDGTLSGSGCAFCNERGSGSGLNAEGMDLAAQWEHWRQRLARRNKARLFLAYLQSFSNTYCDLQTLRNILGQLRTLQGNAGLCIGTRPDCLDAPKLDLLAAQPGEVWLDLGLQSSNDKTLKRINRGHDAALFAQTARRAAARGIQVCAHLMAGLPGETHDDFLASVDFVSRLPVAGVKLHNLYVCKNSPLARDLTAGRYAPLGLEEYVDMLCNALARLRPGIVVHRITGDPAPGELLAPQWAADKQALLDAIRTRLEERDIVQGQDFTQ